MGWKPPRPDLRKRILRRLRRDEPGGLRRAASDALEPWVRGRVRRPPPGKTVLVLFNTHARDSRFWGNMQLSLLAGEMSRLGVDNQLVALLMRPGDEERNLRTVDEFVDLMAESKPAFVVFWAVWLPWLPDRVREVCGAQVMSLDPAQPGDLPPGLTGMNPHGSVLAAVAGARTEREAARVLEPADPIAKFSPRFDYHILGSEEPICQDFAFVSLLSCPYDAPVADNAHFVGLELGPQVSARGCSYCNAARDYAPMEHGEKRRLLAHQIEVLQRELPELAEIAVPFPEDYLAPLADVLEEADQLRLLTLSGQFNSESLGAREAELDRLLTVAAERGYEFRVNVVGLESFDDADLRLYNRGTSSQVREAIAVLRRLRERHPASEFMARTVGSLILFHPWQTLSGLRRNLAFMAGEGIGKLFWRINVNDVRFHPGVALYHLAARDGLLSDPSKPSVQDVPLGGYFTEYPWVFRNRSAAKVHRLYSHLQNDTNERIGLLESCVRLVERRPDTNLDGPTVAAGLEQLARIAAREPGSARGTVQLLALESRSNVGYPRDLFADLPTLATLDALQGRLADLDSPADTRVVLTGAEPAMREDLPTWIRAVRDAGVAETELLTYGRHLAYPRFVARLIGARLDRLSVLVHHPTATGHDAAVRVPGAFDQAFGGLAQLAVLADHVAGAGGRAVRAGLAPVVGPECIGRLDGFVELARGTGCRELTFLLPLANLELDRLAELGDELTNVLGMARRQGLVAGVLRGPGPGWVGSPTTPSHI